MNGSGGRHVNWRLIGTQLLLYRKRQILLHRLLRELLRVVADAGSIVIHASLVWIARNRRNLPPEGRQISMLVVSDLRIDPRVEREARALAQAGYPVTILFPDICRPPVTEQPLNWGSGIAFCPLPVDVSNYVLTFPWLFSSRMYRAACLQRPFAFHCHDLTTSLIGLAAAQRTGARCVCDFHEWLSENVSWNARAASWVPHHPVRRRLYRAIERLALYRADSVVTVCESIASKLEDMGPPGCRVAVVRNIPDLNARPTRRYAEIKRELGVSEESFLVLYQGGTGPTRLLEPVIEAIARTPNTILVIRGPSLDLFGDGYRAIAKQHGVTDRLMLLSPVPSSDVVAAAIGADAGIWTLPNLSKNFYYALPNKIFEYLAAGTPVLAANFPEARKIVESYGVGLCFDPYDPQSIATQIARLVGEPELVPAMRAAIPKALVAIDAEHEWHKLVALYRTISAEAPAARAA
jgi:glycosyltransferase involved in cell wall biosynthesis